MKEINCLRCDTPMVCAGQKKIQLGQTGWILGDLPNLVAGAMLVDIYYCPNCLKLEFSVPEKKFITDDTLPQVTCPNCGRSYDFDYPKCPYCKR